MEENLVFRQFNEKSVITKVEVQEPEKLADTFEADLQAEEKKQDIKVETAEDVKAACNNFEGRHTNKLLFFRILTENVGNKDEGGYINGRIEQTERVNFPEAAVICDTNIKSI